MKKYFPVLFIILFLFSCSNEPAISPNYVPGWQSPVVNGMILTDETGLQYGEFGNPDFPENVIDEDPPEGAYIPQTLLAMNFPYPNPADGLQTIEFSISRPSKVKVWISPAQLDGESSTQVQLFASGNLIDVSGGKAIEILEDGSTEFGPGTYIVGWEASEVPAVFYRIYVQANGVTLWRDVYQCNRFEENPYGFKANSCI